MIRALIQTVDALGFSPASCPAMPRPKRVLLTRPDHFEVAYVINPHMAGHVGTVDHPRAVRQWEALQAAYEQLGITVETLAGTIGQPDMVFCANQALPFLRPDGSRGVVLSRMFAPQRTGEVVSYNRFFASKGYDVLALPPEITSFEGMGDALWHSGRRLLWGGYGIRSDVEAYPYLAEVLETPVILLELIDPDFYHLDTCLGILDEHTALIFPGAFHPEGLALIRACFPRVLEAPEEEARQLLACNAHCPDGRHVLIQQGCTETHRLLDAAGFLPVELDTSEFLKGGGSVFCMKQMLW